MNTRARRQPPPINPAPESLKKVLIPASVHRRLKVAASARGLSLAQYAEDLLEWALDEAEREANKTGR